MSQWNDILLSEIESENVRPGSLVLWFLGGAGFALRTEATTIYIDTYSGPSVKDEYGNWVRMIPAVIDPARIKNVDAIISTNEHDDHCAEGTILPVSRNTKAVFIGPKTSTTKMLQWGISEERVLQVRSYQSRSVNDITITALPAHIPSSKEAFSYIFQSQGITIYHSGDSLYFDKFHEFGSKWPIDVCLLNLGRNLSTPGEMIFMDPCDVVKAAYELGARIVIPFHWDIWKRCIEDPRLVKYIAKEWNVNTQVVILRIGDKFECRPRKLTRNNNGQS